MGTVLKYTNNNKSVLDLGCGTGYMLLMLRELTDIEYFFGYDLSKTFIDKFKNRWGTDKKLIAEDVNFLEKHLPQTDITLCIGVLVYIFDDSLISNMISGIQSNTLIIRVPCNMERLEINKYSSELKSQYAAVYRTVEEYYNILSQYFNVDYFRS